MKIAALQKTSLLDYPEKISAIIFTQGCNFRCGYCHNPELTLHQGQSDISMSAVLDFLEMRKGKLDGIVITGGEPTIHPDLPEFIKEIKQLGFCVKLDTNGTNPKMIENLLNKNLLDYIAMDIKAPLEKYNKIAKTFVDVTNIQKSIDLIMNSGVDYEFRTTVVASQLDFNDFEKIGEFLKGAKKYFLQKFVSSKILDKTLEGEKTYSDSDFEKILSILKTKVYRVGLR